MSKFKVGDMVSLKPMKIAGLNENETIAVCYYLDGEFADDFYTKDLEPLPAPDADKVEQIRAGLRELKRYVRDDMSADFKAGAMATFERVENVIDAITALSGQTPSVDDVKVLREALKPFADQAHLVDDDDASPAYDTLNLCGHYRKARAALDTTKE
jgi:hypothetical protein